MSNNQTPEEKRAAEELEALNKLSEHEVSPAMKEMIKDRQAAHDRQKELEKKFYVNHQLKA